MTNRLRTVSLVLSLSFLESAGCGRANEAREAPREVNVAAAANLRAALDEIARGFESKAGIHVVSTIGATAQLAQQIENGAPVDVFLAADTQHVDQLIAKGLADPPTRAIYARGRLVLWAPQRNDIASLRDLAAPNVGQVGCARPELAPYGAAAIQALKAEGLWKAVEPKLVYGQSISAAKQFADSGNVAAAFTALSLVYGQKGHYVPIDDGLYAPLDQALCIVKQSTQQESARKFREFILGDEGRAILTRYGYTQPQAQ
jgi:molybdate transport system substrate-binding protein